MCTVLFCTSQASRLGDSPSGDGNPESSTGQHLHPATTDCQRAECDGNFRTAPRRRTPEGFGAQSGTPKALRQATDDAVTGQEEWSRKRLLNIMYIIGVIPKIALNQETAHKSVYRSAVSTPTAADSSSAIRGRHIADRVSARCVCVSSRLSCRRVRPCRHPWNRHRPWIHHPRLRRHWPSSDQLLHRRPAMRPDPAS